MRNFAVVSLLVLGIGLSGTWATPARAADIEAKIAAAKTAADHEEIANWYDDQAKAAEAKAEEHRKMGEAYKRAPGPFGKTKLHFHQHCETLVKSYTAEAKEYRALAAAHREMAKKAPRS
jgi:hypothetical protein